MTTLVALVEDGVAYLASDSQSNLGSTPVQGRDAEKAAILGNLIVMLAGGTNHITGLQYAPRLKRALLRSRIGSTAIKNGYAAHILRRPITNYIKEPDWIGFFAGHGKCYSFDHAGFIREVTNFQAWGSGRTFATGALAALEGHPPEERVRRAVEIAIDNDNQSGGQVHVYKSEPDSRPVKIETQ